MKVKRSVMSLLLALMLALGCLPAFAGVFATEQSQVNLLPVNTVKDWRMEQTGDYMSFELVFDENVMPFGPSNGEEYRMMDGNATQKAYASYFKFCEKTVAQINEEITAEDMASWEVSNFPASNGGDYLQPILIFVHQFYQIQFRVHIEYLKTIDGDITFEVVENSEFTDRNDKVWTAGEGLLWTLTDTIKSSGAGNWYTEKPAEPADRESTVGISSITTFRKDTSMSEYYVVDILFSRDVFKTNELGILGYSIQDGSYGDFSFFKNYVTVNGKTIKEVNDQTDDSAYIYTTFSGYPDSLLVPAMLISMNKNQLTVALHETFVADNNLLTTLTIGVLDTFNVIVKAPNQEETKYERVGYTINCAYTFTLKSDKSFSTTNTLIPYTADVEIIERAYTKAELDQMQWDKVNLHSISTIVSIGDVRYYNGDKRTQAQYVVLYFDAPICYQYIPYASGGKVNLSNLASSSGSGVNLTQMQIDAYYDYHMDLYLKDYIRIDGRTITEIQEDETDPTAMPDSAVRVHYAGASSLPSSLVIYIEYNSNAWINAGEEHTIEILKGFRTPLFGEVTSNKTFVYEPVSTLWASVSAGSTFADEELEDNAGGGCSGKTDGTFAICGLAILSAFAIVKIRKGRENNENN